MTDGHCFISYTNAKTEAEAIQLATKLADRLKGEPPNIDVWIDNRSIHAGNWDEQVSDAIKTCKCVLFIVSPDSVTSNSICADELDWALRYKKTIIPIIAYQNAEVPFRLSRRKFVDFTVDFEIALSQLRNLIAWLDTPDGELQKLKDRLADAQRDIRRYPEQTARIEKEIEELNSQIQIQEKVVADPEEAKRETEQKIQNGLERERQPQMPVVGIKSSKFINPPPGVAPNYFQDRTVETKQVFDFLKDGAQRLFTIVGRGGVGKTAMICRLLKHLENSALPEDVQKAFPETKPISIDGIVYLSESGSHRVNFANVFYDLCKLLPKETAQELDAVYKNPQGSTESKMRALLEKFTGEPIALLLDNFEPLVDTETFEIRDTELNEALLAFLNGTHTSVNIVITTRIAPKALNLVQPGRQRVLQLDDGLESPYAENILRDMDADGRMGLKSAPDALLNRARERTRGYPRALEALFAILASDRYTSLEELLEKSTPENVVQELVGEAFNRLDTNAQKVMQALAVYNRPVTPAAVDYLLAPHLPAIDSAPILQRLANMHFARKESGRFYLHPVDREFAFGLISAEDLTAKTAKENQKDSLSSLRASRFDAFTQHDLTSRAADYFRQARKPRAEWKKLDDLSAQLAEFDLRCVAGDYDTAASVLTDIDYDYLLLWGHYRLIINLREKIKGKIKESYLTMSNFGILGSASAYIGNTKSAIIYHEQALSISRERNDKANESVHLGNLGNRYRELGDALKAIEFYEQALAISRETGRRQGEGASLIGIGNAYFDLGDIRKAIEYYDNGLIFARENNDQINERVSLGNLGSCYELLSQMEQAINYSEQALLISQEIQDRKGECMLLGNLGKYYSDYGNFKRSVTCCLQSIQIADEIENVQVQNGARWYLTQSYLFQNDLTNARATIEAALQYDVPQYNHNASALYGIIALRQGARETAQEAFTKSIAQADEILAKTPDFYDALDAKGLALCGLALCARDDGRQTADHGQTTMVDGQSSMVHIQQAIETFRKARKIAPHAGIVKQNLRLFDELMKCEGGEILKDVRKAVEGNPLVE